MTKPKRIFMLGATGTIGRATLHALLAEGHEVVCFLRDPAKSRHSFLSGAELRFGNLLDPASLERDGLRGERFDAIISTLASRTGVPRDAWAIDYQAHAHLLRFAQELQIPQMVLLSAICVQKPVLAFQHAKLRFEQELIASGLIYSIVRPTAYFKSLSGQLERLRAGKPYLIFGDGHLTSCKPISDRDLADYIVDCLTDETRWNKTLPIGGPGEALTPRAQGELIFAALGMEPKFRSVPLGFLKFVRLLLSALGHFNQKLADKAELVRIGLYYASESMLVLNPATGRYDAQLTPSTGRDTLAQHYACMVSGEIGDDRRDHAVF